jgi:CubicO group peptidase (beta-lactamase class C family)
MAKNSMIAIFLMIIMILSTTLSPIDQLESNDVQGVEGRQSAATNFTQMDQDIQDLYDRWSLQGGLQAAIYHNGSLVYANSFGFAVADENGNIPMQNSHRMRLASLTKAITAAAIQTLVVSGDITLNDKMIDLIPDLVPDELEGCEFPHHSNQLDAGPDGVQGTVDDFYWGIQDITVAHLLNMRNGLAMAPGNDRETTSWHYEEHWMEDDGSDSWEGGNNPCIDVEAIAEEYENGYHAPVKIETTIRETLRLPMDYVPGTNYNYSNIGYRILGEIIEEVSGVEFEEYVKETVFEPMGINNFEVGKTLKHKQPTDEVTYYSRNNSTYYSFFPVTWDDTQFGPAVNVTFGNSSSTPLPYGGSGPIEQMAASGGWIGNAINYARFISHLDGTIYHPHFNDSFNFSTVNPFGGLYANGINPSNSGQTWFHTGSLDGTSTRYERRLVENESVVMVLLSNTKPRGGDNPETIPNGQNWSTDRMQVMSKAFTDIDYKNLDAGRDPDRPLVYDESSPCPPGTSEQGSGAHLILFGPPQMKCYYNDQMGKKGPDFDDEKGWQKCPEGTLTNGTGEPVYHLLNKDGGYIACYLDQELFEVDQLEDDDCPEDKVKDHNGRCVPEREEVPSIGMFATILCMVAAGILHKRRNL